MAKQTIVEDAGATARAHAALQNAKRNYKNKKALADKAEIVLADAQNAFDAIKAKHADALRELR